MHILDPKFKYTNAAATDISKTFERVKAELNRQTILNTVNTATKNTLRASMPEMYFPIPENLSEIEIAEGYRLMHQDLEQDYPWGD
jgi:hypothetical protein